MALRVSAPVKAASGKTGKGAMTIKRVVFHDVPNHTKDGAKVLPYQR